MAKTVKDLLNYLKIEASRCVVVKNGEVVVEDEELNDGDYVKILDVVSGG
jgi:sulfur carrier protein